MDLPRTAGATEPPFTKETGMPMLSDVCSQKRYKAFAHIFIIIPILLALSFAETVSAAAWGKIMYPPLKANIRGKRTPNAKLVGQLQAGERIRADFLKDSWYAVFPLREKRRQEKYALGYVYAPLLNELESKRPPDVNTEPREGEPPPQPSDNPENVAIKGISLQQVQEGKELLLVEFDRFCIPSLSGFEGAEPEIVIRIDNVSSVASSFTVLDFNGQFIKRATSAWNPEDRTAHIRLAMEPAKNYFANPLFFQKGNTFCLEITEVHHQPPQTPQ
jgi:hypothetical protein